jgi:glutathione S-transferase
MKTRVCLAELRIPYKSHHTDLVETGCYENLCPRLLDVNPGGTVPVLLHEGHPIYESHEQIRYATRFAPMGATSLVPEDAMERAEMEEWIDRSSLTGNPLENGDKSAGNVVPGLTLPLIEYGRRRIVEAKAANPELRKCLDGV